MNAIRPLLLVAFFTLLAACSNDEPSDKDLEKFLRSKGKIWESGEYWLVKDTAIGVEARVAVFFGYVSDSPACHDAADLLNAKYSLANFRCVPVWN